jgi:pimeloyl-ACP methyl ester carboxylesterase
VSAYAELGELSTYYEEAGAGDPLVLLHPGLADARAFDSSVPGLAERFRVFRPDRAEVVPQPERFDAVVAKLDRMHREEPTLTPADLAGYPGRALVMVGDGDWEIPIEHTLALRDGLPGAQLAVVPGTATGCSRRSRTSATGS